MLEELWKLVKDNAGDSVVNNPDIPNEKNEEVVAEATNTVASGLRNIVAGGGLQNIVALFGNKNQDGKGLLSNPIVNMMIGHFAGKLMNKFNLGGSQAGNVANSLIPSVLGNLINKTNDPSDNTFSLDNLLNSITGGQGATVAAENNSQQGNGLQDILSQLTGGNGNGSGGGLMDIVTKMAGGARSQQERNGSGLIDLIKGFIK